MTTVIEKIKKEWNGCITLKNKFKGLVLYVCIALIIYLLVFA